MRKSIVISSEITEVRTVKCRLSYEHDTPKGTLEAAMSLVLEYLPEHSDIVRECGDLRVLRITYAGQTIDKSLPLY